ncbi:MAG: YhbY family RNA-binding protein [Gammaproteobacteria bacterium]|nr:YhbY family RNA-binding protein [Gammaproteobacteria bacterium]
MELSSLQIKRLRAECHRRGLKPVVSIGQQGLGANQHAEIDRALARHELVKLRIPALPKPEKRELARDLCAHHGAVQVEAIGHVLVLYRQNPKTDRFAAVIAGA